MQDGKGDSYERSGHEWQSGNLGTIGMGRYEQGTGTLVPSRLTTG